MNYQECLRYLNSLGNEVLTMRPGLETMKLLLKELGNPQRDFPAVLVAGTNGKGSAARFLASILRRGGLKTGLYLSPHLVRVEERISVGGETISQVRLAEVFSEVVEGIRRLKLEFHPTYFETLTATAFLFFSQEKIEAAVLEVGLGGRLDSTNVVDPVLSLFTRIGLDHQDRLGPTLEHISREKAGIMRPGREALSVRQRPAVGRVLKREAERLGARLRWVSDRRVRALDAPDGCYRFRFGDEEYRLASPGEHQVENAALALAAAELLAERGWPVGRREAKQAIQEVEVPGVLQRRKDSATVLLDGAHNPDAARALARFLASHTEPPRTLVFGIMRDKNAKAVSAPLRPLFDRVVLTRVNSPRAAAPRDLVPFFPGASLEEDPVTAFERALAGGGTVVVSGSLYLVGEILAYQERRARPIP